MFSVLPFPQVVTLINTTHGNLCIYTLLVVVSCVLHSLYAPHFSIRILARVCFHLALCGAVQ